METHHPLLGVRFGAVAFQSAVRQEPDARYAAGKVALPAKVWGHVNLAWSLFFACWGVVNLYVAFNYSTDAWVNFKLFGATGMMLLFVLL